MTQPLDDKSIDAMSEGELRDALRALRGRYQEMHRRAQVAVPARDRSQLQSLADRYRQSADRWSDSWSNEFSRVCRTHGHFKTIFVAAAKKLGLPHETFHSVNDLPFGRRGDGRVYANVYLDRKKGGIETFDVVETVEKAMR